MMRPFISSLGSGTTESGDLRDLIGGAALDRQRDDLARLHFGLVAGARLDLARGAGGVALGDLLGGADDLGARLLNRQVADALKLGQPLRAQFFELRLLLVQFADALADLPVTLLDLVELALVLFFFLCQALLL